MATVTFPCEQCGKVVSVYRSPSNMKKYPPKFCSLKCTGAAQRGAGNPAYNGGRYIDPNGYVHVFSPNYPNCDCRGYIYEHRVVAEQKLGRSLLDGEVVHHINEIKIDNRPENIVVCASQAEHMNTYHRRGQRWCKR